MTGSVLLEPSIYTERPEPQKNKKGEFELHYVGTDEPHFTRRKQILAAHPEVRELFGPEWRTAPLTIMLVSAQVIVAAWAQTAPTWAFLLVGYVFGGTVNHTLQLVAHELSHNLAFATPAYNRILGIFSNLATGLPSSQTFNIYHLAHHRAQGVDGIDTDIPTLWEARFFGNSRPMKALWVLLQPAFYALRPLVVKPMPPNKWQVVNAVVQILFDIAVVYYLGGYALLYLIFGTLIGMGWHPSAGHFIAEHLEFVDGTETYSYYGSANMVNLNVGYHNEHHDFPKVPWTRLPRVREIAPEFYSSLPCHTSYIQVLISYVTNPNLGPFARIKRRSTAAAKDE